MAVMTPSPLSSRARSRSTAYRSHGSSGSTSQKRYVAGTRIGPVIARMSGTNVGELRPSRSPIPGRSLPLFSIRAPCERTARSAVSTSGR